MGLDPDSRAHATFALLGLEGAQGFYLVSTREFRVGRARSCNLRLDQEGIAREHASLIVSGDRMAVVDLLSEAGTFVNERRIRSCWIQAGDELRFGTVAAVRLVEAQGPTARRGDLVALSAREQEVASLVAQGLTNARVAEALTIRPRTVATHLEHIFAKLGIGSRAELMRLILERHNGL